MEKQEINWLDDNVTISDIVNNLNLKVLKEKLKKKIALFKNFAIKWTQVTYNTKKDGSNYSKIEKNFNNICFDEEDHAYIVADNGKKDYIIVVTYLDRFDKSKNDELLKTHTRYGFDYYGNINKVYHTADEIKREIVDHILILGDKVEKMIKVYDNFEKNEIIKNLVMLKKSMSEQNENSLIIKEIIETINWGE